MCRLSNLLSLINPRRLDYFCCTAFLLSLGEKVGARARTNLFGLEFASYWSINPESDHYPITGLLNTSLLKSTTHSASNLSAVRSSSRLDSIIRGFSGRNEFDVSGTVLRHGGLDEPSVE